MITSINHITLAVNNLEKSIAFYTQLLGFSLDFEWEKGAYLHSGDVWLCVALEVVTPRTDSSHIAFSVTEDVYEELSLNIRQTETLVWKANRSEGKSLYFLDPDLHKLEIHVGDLDSRLKYLTSHALSTSKSNSGVASENN